MYGIQVLSVTHTDRSLSFRNTKILLIFLCATGLWSLLSFTAVLMWSCQVICKMFFIPFPLFMFLLSSFTHVLFSHTSIRVYIFHSTYSILCIWKHSLWMMPKLPSLRNYCFLVIVYTWNWRPVLLYNCLLCIQK